MIFVVTGTERYPFDRLARAVDGLIFAESLTEPVFMQSGACTYLPSCRREAFLPFDGMCRAIEGSRLVIAHAGAGTTLLCLSLGRPVVLMPRRARLGEHIDDHQVTFAAMMERNGLVDVANDASALAELVRRSRSESPPRTDAMAGFSACGELIENLRRYSARTGLLPTRSTR